MQARNNGGRRSWTLMLMLAALAALSPCSTFPLCARSFTIRPLAQAWARKLGTEDRCALSSIRASLTWETAAMQVRVCYAAATRQR